MRCSLCKSKAIYSDKRLCKRHFKSYFEKKVKKVMESVAFRDKRLLVAISGGKDSSALLYSLTQIERKIPFEIEAFYIDLGIKGYSEKSVSKIKELCSLCNIKLNLVSLSDYPKDIDAIAKFSDNVCSVCGTVKRYLMNRFAFENRFDYVLTGHNLDDELYFAINNLSSQHLDYFLRSGKITKTESEKKLIGRAKPLYYLTEKESTIYCLINNLPHFMDECPYSKESTQVIMKKKISYLLDSKDKKLAFLKSVNKLKEGFLRDADNNINQKQKGEGPLGLCKECGFPTSKDVCRFCRIMKE
jgi:uncharacterized protein (TIGR00269 family)